MARYPAEFRQRAVELARLREKPRRQLATDLGISGQTLSNWLKQADIDEGPARRTVGLVGPAFARFTSGQTESYRFAFLTLP